MATQVPKATDYNLAIITEDGKSSFVNLDTDGHEIIGITSLGSSLYVVCVMNDNIFEFSKQSPYARLNTFTVGGMSPSDIVADKNDELLFIMDRRPAEQGGPRVLQFDPSTRDSSELFKAAHWKETLSLLTFPIRQIVGVSDIVEGKQKLGGLNRHYLTGDVDIVKMEKASPQHAMMDEGMVCAYVGYGSKPGEPNHVLELHVRDEMILRETETSLSWPRHLALDIDQNVFVADYWNRRVVRFDMVLNFPSVVLSNATSEPAGSVGWPQRLLWDKDTSNLYVAMAKTPLPTQ